MDQEEIYKYSGMEKFKKKIPTNLQDYTTLYRNSIEKRDEFWKMQAGRLKWDREFTIVAEEDFSSGEISWFSDGKLNACKNSLDVRIEEGRGSENALVYFTSDMQAKCYSFQELYDSVTLLAAALDAGGLKAGDRAALFLPDCPETVIFMLACSRLGIIYVPIPARFTAEITSEIINDCGASLLLVSLDSGQESYRERSRAVIEKTRGVSIIDIGEQSTDGVVSYSDFIARSQEKPPETCFSSEAEYPVFIIYANSAAGIPRGSVFATGGFLVQSAATFDYIFRSNSDNQNADSVFSTLSLASSAGQSCGLWGPLLNGVPVMISEQGEESTSECLRRVLDEFKSPALYTTPTILTGLKRTLQDEPLKENMKFSLVVCCGDVLTPRLVSFAGNNLTGSVERVLNMWIQSESGSALINTYPNSELNHSGALGLPFFGVEAKALNSLGDECRTNESGQLVFASSWPSMIRAIWGQSERYCEFYFRRIPGYFCTNDGVRIDCEGFFWFMGRLDDVIKVRGQSLATSEIEAVLAAHPLISESAVVSTGGGESGAIYAFVVLEEKRDGSETNSLVSELYGYIAGKIGEFAVPGHFILTGELPRTRTGKIVRRILRRVATGDISPDEDMSHVVNPESIKELIRNEG